MTTAIRVEKVSKLFRRMAPGFQLRTLKSALLDCSLIQGLRPEDTIPALEGVSFEVAAGEGALTTWSTRSSATSKKSSTIDPSRATACARTPAGAGFRCLASISGTSLERARTNARLLTLRHISPSPIRQFRHASLRNPGYASDSARSRRLMSRLR